MAREFYICRYGEEDGNPRIARGNDGAMVIIEGNVLYSDATESWREHVKRLEVTMWGKAKRGEAWKTTDPAQETFAAQVVERLNAFPGGPWVAHEGEDYAVVMGAGENTENASFRCADGDTARALAARLNGLPELAVQ